MMVIAKSTGTACLWQNLRAHRTRCIQHGIRTQIVALEVYEVLAIPHTMMLLGLLEVHLLTRNPTGTVRYTPEGEIRWTTISVFSGEERWKSEGIQVGGPGSARGVLGNWFDKVSASSQNRFSPR